MNLAFEVSPPGNHAAAEDGTLRHDACGVGRLDDGKAGRGLVYGVLFGGVCWIVLLLILSIWF
jgi:hypothetical protein